MIIDFIRGNGGGGGTGSTVVVDNLQSTSATEALSANQGRVLNEKFSGYTTVAEMSAYTTTEEVAEAISAATEDMVTSDQITGFTTTADVETQITAATSAFTTSADVQSQITAVTSGLVETTALTAYTPTNGFATINGSAITEGGNIEIQGGGGGTDPNAQHRFTAATVGDMNSLSGVSEGDVCVVASAGTTYGFVEDQAMYDYLSSAETGTTGGIYQGLYELYGNQASGWTRMRVTTVENPYYNAGEYFAEDTEGIIYFTVSGVENEPDYDTTWGASFFFTYYKSYNQFVYTNGAHGYASTGVTQIYDLVSPGVAPSVSGNDDGIVLQGNQLVLHPSNEKLTVAFKIEFYKEIPIPKTFQYNNGEWVELATKSEMADFVSSSQLDPQMEVISTALNDLNSNTVRSTVIRNVVTISQAGYDALVAGGTVDSATFYIII